MKEIQEIKTREKLLKRFNEQKESYDIHKEAKEQHQNRISQNKAKQFEEFMRNQNRLMQKVSDDTANLEIWKAE